MTDQQKRLKEHFLEPEVRNGVKVDVRLKKIWKVELDILEQFIRICTKYDLTWYVIAGTLIGAARHKGFIPWDDDIDVIMPRKDYDKFCEVVAGELEHPYEFMSSAVDPRRWGTSIARICNSNTTAIPSGHQRGTNFWNFGIFVDIIPLDGVTDNRFLYWLRSHLLTFLRGVSRYRFTSFIRRNPIGYIKQKTGYCLYAIFGNKRIERMKYRLITAVPFGSSKMCGAVAINYLRRDNFPTELFDGYVEMPFEYLTVRCPTRYDELLTCRYGDWRTCKPQEVYHSFYFDPDTPYLTSLREKFGYTDEDFERWEKPLY